MQARAILFYASKEMEEKMTMMKTPRGSYDAECSPTQTPTPTPTPTPTSTRSSTSTVVQMSSPTAAGLSMKRSLQRFLQKRKHRVQAASPYHHQPTFNYSDNIQTTFFLSFFFFFFFLFFGIDVDFVLLGNENLILYTERRN